MIKVVKQRHKYYGVNIDSIDESDIEGYLDNGECVMFGNSIENIADFLCIDESEIELID